MSSTSTRRPTATPTSIASAAAVYAADELNGFPVRPEVGARGGLHPAVHLVEYGAPALIGPGLLGGSNHRTCFCGEGGRLMEASWVQLPRYTRIARRGGLAS